MKNYINFNKVQCKDCYKCLRYCPVKSMRFSSHHAEIIESDCILCGKCYQVCPQGAKEIRNDVPVVKALLKSNKEVYVTLAPSFVANYKGYTFESLEEALKQLGFAGVEETAIGAEIVSHEYERIINEGKQDIIISTCCPTVNLLIRKYYPESVKNMAKVTTPMITHARLIRKEHKNAPIVFIGPCLSKKEEVDENLDVIDCAITFKELNQWFKEEHVHLNKINKDDKKYLSRLYPTGGGIIKTMTTNPAYKYVEVDGIERCKQVLNEIKNGLSGKYFIEMSSCEGSCVNGPGMDIVDDSIIESYSSVINYSGTDHYNVNEKINTNKEFVATPVSLPDVPEDIIKMLLAKLGKTKLEDELNCGSCGYDTCREKAKAMYYGKTEPSMCLPFLKNKAEGFMDDIIDNTPNAIIILNDKLEIQLINKSACDIIKVNNAKDVIDQPIVRLFDSADYVNVLNSKEKVTQVKYLAEYNKYVDETILYDSKFNIIMIIMRDVTTETLEKSKRQTATAQTIEVTDQIIEKQMRSVQEIASLLGETTAETKVALIKLKESLNDKRSGDK